MQVEVWIYLSSIELGLTAAKLAAILAVTDIKYLQWTLPFIQAFRGRSLLLILQKLNLHHRQRWRPLKNQRHLQKQVRSCRINLEICSSVQYGTTGKLTDGCEHFPTFLKMTAANIKWEYWDWALEFKAQSHYCMTQDCIFLKVSKQDTLYLSYCLLIIFLKTHILISEQHLKKRSFWRILIKFQKLLWCLPKIWK